MVTAGASTCAIVLRCKFRMMTIEKQIEILEQLGLKVNEGITIDDFVSGWGREEFERTPFDLVLFDLGGQRQRGSEWIYVSNVAWHLDMECIYDTGDYVRIAKNLCRISGMPELFENAADFVDIENSEAWLRYRVDGRDRHHSIEVHDDWADPAVVEAIMRDIERDGKHFYGKDNGQGSTWYFLDRHTARELNRLSGNALQR